MSERLGPIYATTDYAGFIRRSLALLVDLVLLAVLGASMDWAWRAFAPKGWRTESALDWIKISWLGTWFAYLVGLRMTERGTLGYRLVGIRYATVTSEPPSWLRLAYRALVEVYLLRGFLLDHFWILADERKQAWHDKLSGFYVVKRRAQPIGTQRVVRRVIHFMTLTFEVWEPAKEQPSA